MTDQSKILHTGEEFHAPVAFADLAQSGFLKQFFSSILHELHQPLVAIRLLAENGRAICGEDANCADKLRALFEDVGKSAELTIRTIGRMRSFVKGQAPSFGPTDVNDAMLEILQLAEIVASSRGVSIVKTFESGLGSVWADRGALQEAFLNLVFNAIEAIEHEDGPTISVYTRDAGDAIEVVVADTGCGIPEDHRDKLFEHEFTTKPQGSGLGLGIVRDIIEQHGGTVFLLHSGAGEGTSFCVRLPTTQPSQLFAQIQALPQTAEEKAHPFCNHEPAREALADRWVA